MVVLHKFFKFKSLRRYSSDLLFVATAAVFASCKLLYVPVALSLCAEALFIVERQSNPVAMMRVSLTNERLRFYCELLEKTEYEILETIGFEFEIELPYKHIRKFCEKFVPVATREVMH